MLVRLFPLAQVVCHLVHFSICAFHPCVLIFSNIVPIISAATDPNSVGYHQPACSRFCKRIRKGNLARLKQCPGVGQAHLYGKKAVAKARAKNYSLLRVHTQISFCAQRFRRPYSLGCPSWSCDTTATFPARARGLHSLCTHIVYIFISKHGCIRAVAKPRARIQIAWR